jgi:hypothetical protein
MLREGIEAQYLPPCEPATAQVAGRVAKRKANYALAIASASQWRSRLSVAAEHVPPATAAALPH